MGKARVNQKNGKERRGRRLRIAIGVGGAVLLAIGVLWGLALFRSAPPPTPGSATSSQPSPSEDEERSAPDAVQRTVEELVNRAESTGDLSYYREALALSPDDVDARLGYGAALSLTDPDAALEQLSRVLELDPQNLDALELYGGLMLRGKRFAPAAEHYEKVLKALEERGERDSERGLEIAKKLGQAYVGWAGQLLEGSDEPRLHEKAYELLDKAEPLLQEGLEAEPQSDALLMAFGDLHMYREAYPRAIEYYENVIEHHPRNVEAWVKLGRAHFEGGDLENAEEAFRTAWERAPQLAAAALGLGDVYRTQDRLDEAIRVYREGFREAPDRPFPPKEELTLRLLEVDPQNVEAHRWLAGQYLGIRRYVNAITHYEALLRLAGELPLKSELKLELQLDAHQGLGEARLGMTQYGDAKESLRRAIELAPQALQQDELVHRLTALYEKLLEADRAWRGHGRMLGPDGMEALLELVRLYLKQGELVAAKAKLLVLRRDYPFYHADEVALLAEELAHKEEQQSKSKGE